jgi:hypothetical protein
MCFHWKDVQIAYQNQRVVNFLTFAEKKPLPAGPDAVLTVKMALSQPSAGAALTRANAELLGRSHLCHCEERSDEAISTPSRGDCFASLAMTSRVVPSNGFAFALLP